MLITHCMKKKNILLLTALMAGSTALTEAQTIRPYGALPSKAQVAWNDLEYYMFIHFGPNTFTNKEWGHGDEDPKVFNPKHLDARQWARTAKLAGMKGIVITAKHHDGFCLWPSKYSTHTVRESAWKDGKGDVLKELSAACKEYGLKFGVYLSPWDRNHPAYGTPDYNKIFASTLEEVLTGYGPVFEQWFDGASDGQKKQAYDWPLFHKVVYKHQPNAVIFSDVGPGCRWVGNENGFAGTTNWSTINVNGYTPGAGGPPQKTLNEGDEDGSNWIPAECDVSIRPGWFYSPDTDDKVKTIPQLLDIYYASVGRNGNLILNVPVNRDGLIHPNDSTRLMELRRILDATFRDNLAKKAVITASATRKNTKPASLTDGNKNTYWATPDETLQADVTLALPAPVTFNRVALQEFIPLGQRVKAFAIDVWDGKEYKEIAQGTTIGHKRILQVADVTASRVRVRFLDAKAGPVINEIGLYRAPEILSTPVIRRSKSGEVNIACAAAGPAIHYTTDGSEPTLRSPLYSQPFALPEGGVVKARAFINKGKSASPVVTAHYDVAPAGWKVIHTDNPAAGNDPAAAIDANPDSYWVSNRRDSAASYPHEIQVDLGKTMTLKGFTYLPRRESQGGGLIYTYAFYVSNDGKNWGTPVSKGHFDNIKNNPVLQSVRFPVAVSGRYIRLEALQPADEQERRAAVAELGIITK